MYASKPGVPDLVYHTVKHFLDEGESTAWDQLPHGTLTAGGARAEVHARAEGALPTGQPVDPRWWWPPWLAHARRAHDEGYGPRYQFLVGLSPDPASPRWENAAGGRRLSDFAGFRVVLEPRGVNYQVVTAFFSTSIRGAEHLRQLGPALRAFAARRDCPPAAPPGVPTPETKS